MPKHQAGATCPHPKPLFSNGRERKFCFACSPKPEPKPRKAYALKNAGERICKRAGCGASFAPKAAQQRFCSTVCQSAHNSESRYRNVRSKMGRDCRWCKTPYVPEVGLRQKYYCAEGCRLAALRAMRSDSTHRRRAKKFGCSYEPVSKRKVFERDGWACRICGVSTPEAKRGTIDDDAPELDHIIPLAKRGDHSYLNTQCACRRCNLLKSDMSAEEAAALLVAARSARRIVDASKTEVDLPQGGVRRSN